jgi:hypothetical protein
VPIVIVKYIKLSRAIIVVKCIELIRADFIIEYKKLFIVEAMNKLVTE